MKMAANSQTEANVYIYGEIVNFQWDDTDVSASSFKNDLNNLGDLSTINLFVNSPGGSVFEGVAIYNMLKRHKAKINVHVDGVAASIASVIAMSGDTIFMPKNSMLMVHNPWTIGMGNATDFRKLADDLDRIGNSAKQTYLSKAGDKLAEDTLQTLLDNETWLSADEALAFGLCDVVEEANQMAACADSDMLQKYKNVPKALLEQPKNTISAEEMAERQLIAKQAQENISNLNTILGGM